MRKGILLLIGALVALVSCQTDKEGSGVLAQIGDAKLMLDEVLEKMPASKTSADSIAFIREYVDQWVDEELVYQQGVRHLNNLEQLLEQVREYRRLLVTQTYDREMLRQHVEDLTDEECQAFYEKYGKQLVLAEPVMKGFYVKVPTDKKNQHKNMKTWLKQLSENNTDHMEELQQYLNLHAVDYDGFLEQWMPLNFVAERLPEQVVDAASFMKLGLKELTDDDFSYYLLLTDYRLEGEEMPFEYALPQIREILLNQQSREYLKAQHKAMRDKALRSGKLYLDSIFTSK